MDSLRQIVVAVDFHGASLRALEYAERVARTVDADVTLIHSLDLSSRAYSALVPAPELTAELRARASRDLEPLVQQLRADGVRATSVVRDGRPADEVLDAAQVRDADLIVIGTHGRHGLSRMILGSVAEEIVRRSPTPVVTLHEWRFDDRASAARRLAQSAAPFRNELNVIVAITLGAVPLAVEVAQRLGKPVEVFFVAPIAGHGAVPRGSACETGEFLLDDAQPEEAIIDSALGDAVAAARARAVEFARAIRGASPPGKIEGTRALVVTDELFTPGSVVVAAGALRRLGAKGVSLAVPVCSAKVLAALPAEIERRICVDATHVERAAARVYRDEEEPSTATVKAMLAEATRPHPFAPPAAAH